jgi:hypothetical protein
MINNQEKYIKFSLKLLTCLICDYEIIEPQNGAVHLLWHKYFDLLKAYKQFINPNCPNPSQSKMVQDLYKYMLENQK